MPNPIVKPGMMVYDTAYKWIGWVVDREADRLWLIEYANGQQAFWSERYILAANREFKKFAKAHEEIHCRAGNNAV